ncbi:MAG: glutaredoxin 3 [Pseudomonadota bacterium]
MSSKATSAGSVEIYSSPMCPYCMMAKRLLKQKGVAFSEVNVMGNRSAKEEMMQRANGRHTVPQIFIDNVHVGGCDELYALDDAGKLDPMLKGAA